MKFAIDCETELVTKSSPVPELVCLTVWCEESQEVLAPREARAFMQRHVTSATFVGANVAYDMFVLLWDCSNWGIEITAELFEAYDQNRVLDVLCVEKLIDQKTRGLQHKYSLESVAAKYGITMEDPEGWQLRFSELKDVPIEDWPYAALKYCADDGSATWEIHKAQEVHPHAYDLTRDSFWLRELTNNGLSTDPERVAAFRSAMSLRREAFQYELSKLGLVRADGTRDTRKVEERVLAAYGENVPRTKGGAVSTASDVCEDAGDPVLFRHGDEDFSALQAYSEYSSLAKVFSTDLPQLELGTIRGHFNELLKTGRTSQADPNMQNVRRLPGIRECVVPRDGNVFIDSDYGKLELCTWAQVCVWLFGQSNLATILNAGQDPHLALAAQMLGMTYEEAIYFKDHEEFKNTRDCSKVGNFGFPGGMSARTFVKFAKKSYGVTLDLELSENLRENWFSLLPEARMYFDFISQQDQGDGTHRITHPVSLMEVAGLSFCSACNALFQALGAVVAKRAGWRLVRETYSKKSVLYACRVVHFIHDQFLIEVGLGRSMKEIRAAAARVKEIMDEVGREILPDVPVRCEPLLASCWSKKAKRVLNERGELEIWSPT